MPPKRRTQRPASAKSLNLHRPLSAHNESLYKYLDRGKNDVDILSQDVLVAKYLEQLVSTTEKKQRQQQPRRSV